MALGAAAVGILSGLGAAAGGAAAQGAGSFFASRTPAGKALKAEQEKAATRLRQDDYRDEGRVLQAQSQLRDSIEGSAKETEMAALQGMRSGGFGRGGAEQEALGRLGEAKAGGIAQGTGQIEKAEAQANAAERAQDLGLVAGRAAQVQQNVSEAVGAGVELGTAVGLTAGKQRHKDINLGQNPAEKGADAVLAQAKGAQNRTGLASDYNTLDDPPTRAERRGIRARGE